MKKPEHMTCDCSKCDSERSAVEAAWFEGFYTANPKASKEESAARWHSSVAKRMKEDSYLPWEAP